MDRAYADLLREYGFNLVSWLRGSDTTPLVAVIWMLRGLPDHCGFKAHWFATLELRKRESGEPEDMRTDEQREFDFLESDYAMWSATNMQIAMVTNAVNNNTRGTGMYPKGKAPEFDVVGPYAWWPDKQKKALERPEKKSAATVKDFYRMFGASGESSEE